MYSKNFQKILLLEFFCLGNPFWTIFAANWGQKISFEKNFLKKNSEKYFFKKMSKIISFI